MIKERIVQDENIATILEELGCEQITDKGKYYQSTRPQGDNKSSVLVYKNNLVSKCYTLNIEGDIITLVQEFKKLNFFQALKWICDVCEYDYYENIFEVENSSKDWEWINKLDTITEEEQPLKPLSEHVLNRYIQCPNEIFLKEFIDVKTQKEFELGVNLFPEPRITIPIRDELGSLVGVKGRALERSENKYIYLYPCNKGRLLYGLHKGYEHIKQCNEVIVFEAEKSVLKAWSYGIKNVVALGGKHLSEEQEYKLLKLDVPITLALDKDVKKNEIKDIVKRLSRTYQIISIVIDTQNILDEKESPIDNLAHWETLYKNKKIYTRG